MIESVALVVIVHGSYGSPDENWFPWLADEIRRLGHKAVVPRLPTPEGQNLESWHKEFSHQVGPLTENMVLAGHSLAPGFILSLLERSDVTVQGTFLVSGFLGKLGLEEFDLVNETFVCREFDWEAIRQRAGEIHVYNSDTDPYVPLERGEELASKLGVELNVIHDGGHINTGAGFRDFPQLLADIKRLID